MNVKDGKTEMMGVMVGMDREEVDHFNLKKSSKENHVIPANREKLHLCSRILMESNLQFMVTCPTCQLDKKKLRWIVC